MHVKKNSETSPNVTVPLRSLVLVSFAVILAQSLIGLVIYWRIDSWTNRANFGEMFGVASTLFSGLAFAGIIYAVLLQRRELELQRIELELTRHQLKRSAEAQEKSERALAEQVRLMNQTARLNSLNLMLEAQKSKIDLMQRKGWIPSSETYLTEELKFTRLFEQLETLVEEISTSTTT